MQGEWSLCSEDRGMGGSGEGLDDIIKGAWRQPGKPYNGPVYFLLKVV
jgi:hypothetical protein